MPEHGDHEEHGGAAARDAEVEQTEGAGSSASTLFDIRRVIGGLFTLYGVLVAGTGLFDGAGASKKASGIDINIWTGLGMLALGLTMLLWMKLSPVSGAPAGGDDGDDGDDADDGSAGSRRSSTT